MRAFEAATAASPAAWWAWRGLALLRRANGLHDSAIAPLQRALRSSPQDAQLWTWLADSYRRCDRVTGAQRAAARAVVLADSPRAVADALCVQGQVYAACECWADSARAHLRALGVAPCLVASLHGAAHALLHRGREERADGRQGRARATFAQAARAAARAAVLAPGEACVWKSLGDALLAEAQAVSTGVDGRGDLAAFAHEEEEEEGEGKAFLGALRRAEAAREALATRACRAYGRGVAAAPTTAVAWHDLGLALLWLTRLRERRRLQRADEDGPLRAWREAAQGALTQAVRLSPLQSSLWNALGVACRPEVKFHCFARAVSLDNAPQAWNNAGMLLTEAGDSTGARDAFVVSQGINPASSLMWLGRAMLSGSRLRASDAGSGGGDDEAVLRAAQEVLDALWCAVRLRGCGRAPRLACGHAALLAGDAATALPLLEQCGREEAADALCQLWLGVARERMLGSGPDAATAYLRAAALARRRAGDLPAPARHALRQVAEAGAQRCGGGTDGMAGPGEEDVDTGRRGTLRDQAARCLAEDAPQEAEAEAQLPAHLTAPVAALRAARTGDPAGAASGAAPGRTRSCAAMRAWSAAALAAAPRPEVGLSCVRAHPWCADGWVVAARAAAREGRWSACLRLAERAIALSDGATDDVPPSRSDRQRACAARQWRMPGPDPAEPGSGVGLGASVAAQARLLRVRASACLGGSDGRTDLLRALRADPDLGLDLLCRIRGS